MNKVTLSINLKRFGIAYDSKVKVYLRQSGVFVPSGDGVDVNAPIEESTVGGELNVEIYASSDLIILGFTDGYYVVEIVGEHRRLLVWVPSGGGKLHELIGLAPPGGEPQVPGAVPPHDHDGRYYTKEITDELFGQQEVGISAAQSTATDALELAQAAAPLAALTAEIEAREGVASDLTNHSARNDNPHGVTAEQIGLGNVDNTADLDKPVSAAQAEYIFDALALVVGGSGSALDTLYELAQALGNDPNFAATVNTALAGKQPKDDDLTAIAALTTTPFGRALLELANTAALRSAAGLNNVSNDAQLKMASNLGDLDNVATARTNLQLANVAATGSYGDLSNKPTLGGAAALNVGTAAGTVMAGNDSRVLAFPIPGFVPGKLGSSLTIWSIEAAIPFTLPANLATSRFKSGNPATATPQVSIRKNGVEIGTLTWAAGAIRPVVSFPSTTNFSNGTQAQGGTAPDVLSLVAPVVADATLNDLRIFFVGSLL